MSEKLKYCKDCRYIEYLGADINCLHWKASLQFITTQDTAVRKAAYQRLDNNQCGQNGKNFKGARMESSVNDTVETVELYVIMNNKTNTYYIKSSGGTTGFINKATAWTRSNTPKGIITQKGMQENWKLLR